MALQIDIVSDFVCPWCWLGWKQFRASGVKGEVSFRPYLLDPLVPREGADYQSFMKAKTAGAPDRYKAMREHLGAAAPDYGITFHFNEMRHRPNTINAHRLMRWAEGQDAGLACAEALFRANFGELRDIGDTDVLCSIAEEVGLYPEVVRKLLESDADEAKVQEEVQFFRRLGVRGVPTFIYNGDTALQGAQDPATHREAAKQARQQA